MCGICGVFDFTGHAELTHERLRALADTMVHRGPDDWGTYLSPDRRVGFGFRRLSIVDLTGGHQPMSNEDSTIWVVFNGEIYNHPDLRRVLEAQGHVYRTRCDTETIIHAYEEWGSACVERMRGMFAFAIWDESKQELLLARDRIGIKPLYYTEQGGQFLFASEIKAILASPGVKREVDLEALYHYLTFLVTPAPLTLFQGVHKLPPGHTMTLRADGHSETACYWDPIFPQDGTEAVSEKQIIERLREMLRESIHLRMMSDVPFGVFLSGGVDSSLNVALMSEMMDRPVDTFSVAIRDDPRSDELSYAQRVAQYFDANHHETVISSRDFIEFLPQLIYHQDEPLADPVCVPLYYVSRLARENGTIVIQVGEGADELFSGYTNHAFFLDFYRRYWRQFAALPRWIKLPIAVVGAQLLPARRAEYLRRAAHDEALFWRDMGFCELEKKELMQSRPPGVDGRGSYAVVEPHYTRMGEARPDASLLDQMIYLELKHRLPELLLMRVDKMTMATSIEARVPYLDHELVRFALSIPAALKHKNGQTKYILRQAARGIVPDEVIDRPKWGFCGSATNMITAPIVDYAERVVLGSDWLTQVLNVDYLRQLFADQQRGRFDNGNRIWLLLNLALWHRHWIEGEEIPA